jgi:hypothetical protein
MVSYTQEEIREQLKVSKIDDWYFLHIPLNLIALAPTTNREGLVSIEKEAFYRLWGRQHIDGYRSKPIDIPTQIIVCIWDVCGAKYLDTVAYTICTIINYENLRDFGLFDTTIPDFPLPSDLTITL